MNIMKARETNHSNQRFSTMLIFYNSLHRYYKNAMPCPNKFVTNQLSLTNL